MKYIVANWKSNKTADEVEEWFDKIRVEFGKINSAKLNSLKIIICPPYVYLPLVKKLTIDFSLPFELGAQDVSPFGMGAYTGEVCAKMLTDFAKYVIVGHSERRNYFHEDDKFLGEKVKQINSMGLEAIFCIQDAETIVPEGVTIAAYEPVWAIGSGKADTPENAKQVISFVKQKSHVDNVLYGGSVTPENIKSYLAIGQIDGVLIGGASLVPEKFWEIIINASIY